MTTTSARIQQARDSFISQQPASCQGIGFAAICLTYKNGERKYFWKFNHEITQLTIDNADTIYSHGEDANEYNIDLLKQNSSPNTIANSNERPIAMDIILSKEMNITTSQLRIYKPNGSTAEYWMTEQHPETIGPYFTQMQNKGYIYHHDFINDGERGDWGYPYAISFSCQRNNTNNSTLTGPNNMASYLQILDNAMMFKGKFANEEFMINTLILPSLFYYRSDSGAEYGPKPYGMRRH